MNEQNAIGPNLPPEQLTNSPDTKAIRLLPQKDGTNTKETTPEERRQHQAAGAEVTEPAPPQSPEALVPVRPEPREVAVQAAPEVPVAVTPAEPDVPEMEEDERILPVKPRRKVWPVILGGVAALALIVGATVFLHYHSYQNAITLAERDRYADARENLILPELTELYDPDFLTYLDAGIALQTRDFDQALSLIAALSDQNYRSAEDILQDAYYYQGLDALDAGDFDLAMSYLEPLANSNYRDSSVLLLEIQYRVALRAWEVGDYVLAREYLEPLAVMDYEDSVTLLMDISLTQGLDAYAAGDLALAQAYLEPLAETDYGGAATILQEITYLQGEEALTQGNYKQAMSYLEELAESKYLDSLDLYRKAKLGYAVELVSHENSITDLTSGLNYLKQLVDDKYSKAKAPYDAAQKTIYERAIKLYDSGNRTNAVSYFSLIRDYSRAKDYLTLCNAHEGKTSVKDLWALHGFADADQLMLTQDYLCQFLVGRWTTANGTYYCTMESGTNGFQYYFSYNLPWQYNGNFQIEDGVYQVFHNGGSAQNEFRFRIVSWNQIQVYCYKNGSTYTLTRR